MHCENVTSQPTGREAEERWLRDEEGMSESRIQDMRGGKEGMTAKI